MRRTERGPAVARRPTPEPLEIATTRIVAIGTAVWAAALVALLPFHGSLVAHGHGWLVWMCVAGLGLGLIGLPVSARMQRLSATGSPGYADMARAGTRVSSAHRPGGRDP